MLDARLPKTICGGREVEYILSADAAAAQVVYNLEGMASTFNCLFGVHCRHGKHGSDHVGAYAGELRTADDMAARWPAEGGLGPALDPTAPILPVLVSQPVPSQVPATQDPTKAQRCGAKGPPLSTLFCPQRSVMEVLHATINLVKTLIDHLDQLAKNPAMGELVDLFELLKRMDLERPQASSWGGDEAWAILVRREEWLAALRPHPNYAAIARRVDLLYGLLKVAREDEPSPESIAQFGVDADELAELLITTWGGKDDPDRYYFRFYDHALLNHAFTQLQQYGSLGRYATWFLEHGNKWLKANVEQHTAHGGGVKPAPLAECQQALQRMLQLTSPEVRKHALHFMQRTRALYRCSGCHQLKPRGHKKTCVGARERAQLAAALTQHTASQQVLS